jgi:hypothetical protein
MRTRLVGGALAATTILLAVGCGGKSLDPEKVASCLRGKNFTVSHLTVSAADADYVAHDVFYVSTSPTAKASGLDSRANVSFGDAHKLEQNYATGGTGRVDTRANALVVWDEYEPAGGKLLLTCLE